MSEKDKAERRAKWVRIVLAVGLVLVTAAGPVAAQTATTTATPTDSGPDYPPCNYGPPVPGQVDYVEENETKLLIETRGLITPNSTHGYEVYRYDPGEGRTLVTENATVTSSNATILSVNQSAHTVSSIADQNVSTWVRLNATTPAENSGCVNVIVSEPKVSALELTPGIWRFAAVLGNATLFALLIAVFLAVAAARFTSAFGGLAIGQITLTVGWLGGWVSWAIVVASLFSVLFIGMNLAANTSYMAGGGFRQ